LQNAWFTDAYNAIDLLFPKNDQAHGDINLVFSHIHTLSGGDIDLLAPYGNINAGITNSALGNKRSSDLGVVVQAAGKINAYVHQDFSVNESRVFDLGGGDITVWASEGNVDAGRGAKSALSAPPTQTYYDANGNLVVVFPPVLAGSGIRTSSSNPNQEAGNVYLFAPRGVVDAGEAGIGGNKVIIVAKSVIGGSNINFNDSQGIPSAPAAIAVPAGATNAASASSRNAEDKMSDDSKNKDAAERNKLAAAGIINIDLLGFGNCSVEDVRNGKEGCGG
jgi:hypothetical protein